MKKLLEGKKIEWIVLLLFSLSFIVVSVFHEPWFDEAQAWEIAKGASLREILFVIPHYEGHPPLWHLILSLPAKLGVPFEIGLKTIGAIFSISIASLLVFKSKLPRVVRLCLPFSYFIFYQYGVIVRPYGLMLLVILLLGMNFSHRKDQPWRITILLALLCLCSAYGIIISGGIAICLTIELILDKGVIKALSSFFHDSRSLSLFALLLLAVLLMLEIIPKSDTYYAAYNNQNPFALCWVCALFTFPVECFFTTSSWFSIDRTLLQISSISTTELIIFCIIGLIFWIMIISSASKKSIQFLLIPYVLLATFSAKVYFSGHHLGVIFMFFLFWAEYISGEEDCFEIGKIIANRIVTNPKDYKLLKLFCGVIGLVCIIVPLAWTAVSSVNDINYNYDYGKEVAEFLEVHGLEDLRIFAKWSESGSSSSLFESDEDYVNTVMIGTAVPVNAYFKKNIFYNLNHGDPQKGFIYHRRPTHDEVVSDLDEWYSMGYPDVLVGKPDLECVFGEELTYEDYKLVAVIKSKFIWKTSVTSGIIPVYLKTELLDKYELEALDGLEYIAINGFKITDEMKERYEKGESIEDILKPYLDALFGE